MNEPVTGPYEPAVGTRSTSVSSGGQHSTGAEKTVLAAGLDAGSIAQRGNFTIVKEHARGGLGKVSLARDARLKRTVALKEIRPDRHVSDILRQRFIAEAEITGMLEHPGVVPIYAFEEDDRGQPYYAMRFIEGKTLGKAIRDWHHGPGRSSGASKASAPSNDQGSCPAPDYSSMIFRELLQRFISVCQTIAYAHNKDVIHRDLKPENIMLGDYGETLVLDWGLAKKINPRAEGDSDKEMDATGQLDPMEGVGSDLGPTQAGQVLGTPAYMSPEQAEGDEVGRATDIYALGAILYELLTGRRPYPGKSAAAAIRQVRSGPPVDLASIQKHVPKPLAAICRKAMARRSANRYATAADLAKDVDRWLADEPVSAAPDPLPVRARRWARKHPRSMASMAATLLVGLAALTVGLAAVERERKQTAAERDEKGRALLAETKAREAEQQARELELDALRVMSDEVVGNLMARGASLTDEDKSFLRTIIKHYEAFAAVTGDSAESRAIRAEGYYNVGYMRLELGELASAESALRNALDLLKLLVAEFPDRSKYRQALSKTHGNLGILFEATGRPKESESAYREQLALKTRLVADFPDQPEFRLDLAKGHNNLGSLYFKAHRFTEAERAIREAVALKQRLVDDFPTSASFRQQLANSCNNLGHLLQETGRARPAESAYREAVALQKQLANDFPTKPVFRRDLARTYNNLSGLLQRSGRPQDAEAVFRDSLALHKQLAADFPAQPEFRQELARCADNWGGFLQMTGRPQDAEAAHRDALAINKRLAADFPSRPEFRQQLVHSQNSLGYLLQNTGRIEEAEAAFRDALTIGKKLAAELPSQPDTREALARVQNNLGLLLQRTGRTQEAEAAYRDAAALQKQLVTDFPTKPNFRAELARSQNNLAVIYTQTGRTKEAEATMSAAALIQKRLAADFPEMADFHYEAAGTLGNLANLCNGRGDFRAAKAYLDEAEPHHQTALKGNPRHPAYRQFYRNALWIRTNTNAGLLDQTGAMRAAEKLRDLGWDPAADAFTAALALTGCIPIVANVDALDPAMSQAAVQFYGDQAVAMLRAAMAKGLNDSAKVKNEGALDPLRSREDFKNLLADLELKQKESGASNEGLEKKQQ